MTKEQMEAITNMRDTIAHQRDQLLVISRSEDNRLAAKEMGEWLAALDALLAELRQAKADAVTAHERWRNACGEDGDVGMPLDVHDRVTQYAAELAGEESKP